VSNSEQRFRDKVEKLIDDGVCTYVRIENEGRFAVTDNILKSAGLNKGQVITMDTFRAIIQIHENELIEFQKELAGLRL